MPELRTFDEDSAIFRVFIPDSASSTGGGKSGLAYNTSGLVISTIADNEASPTTYTAAGSTIETISTLGTYAVPTATKCRFKEVDATNHPGVYEVQLADARLAVASAKALLVTISGASGVVPTNKLIQLKRVNLDDATRAGLSALPNAAAEAAGGLVTRGTGTGQLYVSTGNVRAADTGGNAIATAASITAVPAAVWAALTSGMTTAGSIGKKLADWVLGTDSKILVSSDAQDLSAALSVNAKKLNGATPENLAAGAAMTLTSGERVSVAEALLDLADGVETSLTLRQAQRLFAAVLCGKAAESAGTVTFKRRDGTTVAVTVVHDTSGNRSSSTIGTL
jgi:hypothetical protein